MTTPMIDSRGPSQPSILARRPMPTAMAIGAASLLPHAFLPRQASLAFAAVLIALIAGIYFGFAVVNGQELISDLHAVVDGTGALVPREKRRSRMSGRGRDEGVVDGSPQEAVPR
jgi:hypothetical protein